eukprot:3312-Heterococcus_DN1.PRE.1
MLKSRGRVKVSGAPTASAACCHCRGCDTPLLPLRIAVLTSAVAAADTVTVCRLMVGHRALFLCKRKGRARDDKVSDAQCDVRKLPEATLYRAARIKLVQRVGRRAARSVQSRRKFAYLDAMQQLSHPNALNMHDHQHKHAVKHTFKKRPTVETEPIAVLLQLRRKRHQPDKCLPWSVSDALAFQHNFKKQQSTIHRFDSLISMLHLWIHREQLITTRCFTCVSEVNDVLAED